MAPYSYPIIIGHTGVKTIFARWSQNSKGAAKRQPPLSTERRLFPGTPDPSISFQFLTPWLNFIPGHHGWWSWSIVDQHCYSRRGIPFLTGPLLLMESTTHG